MKAIMLIAGLFLVVTMGAIAAPPQSGWSKCVDACRTGKEACLDKGTVDQGVCFGRYQACLDRCDDRYRDDSGSGDDPIIPLDPKKKNSPDVLNPSGN